MRGCRRAGSAKSARIFQFFFGKITSKLPVRVRPIPLPQVPFPSRRIPLFPWLFALAAGIAAMGINQFGLSVFGDTELLFGGWLPLLVTLTVRDHGTSFICHFPVHARAEATSNGTSG